jgi:DNA-binding NarL/FixJ family response regulator
MQPKILLADDHGMIRNGLKASFKFELGYTDIAEVSSCSELMKELKRANYTHLVLDINLSDGSSLEVLPNIRQLYPRLKIAALSMQPPNLYARVLRQFGTYYYINKSALNEDTTRLLKQFLSNEPYPGEDLVEDEVTNPFSNLTDRELQVLHYLLKGFKVAEIADELNLAVNTISTVKARLFEKTGVQNVVQLVELAALFNVKFK